jgi:hypothetical protein
VFNIRNTDQNNTNHRSNIIFSSISSPAVASSAIAVNSTTNPVQILANYNNPNKSNTLEDGEIEEENNSNNNDDNNNNIINHDKNDENEIKIEEKDKDNSIATNKQENLEDVKNMDKTKKEDNTVVENTNKKEGKKRVRKVDYLREKHKKEDEWNGYEIDSSDYSDDGFDYSGWLDENDDHVNDESSAEVLVKNDESNE